MNFFKYHEISQISHKGEKKICPYILKIILCKIIKIIICEYNYLYKYLSQISHTFNSRATI